MYKYVGSNTEHRHKVVVGVGRQCLILPFAQDFVVDVLARKYRTNEGLTVAVNVDLIQDIMPKLIHIQAHRSFMLTIQPGNRHLINQNLVVAQGKMMK